MMKKHGFSDGRQDGRDGREAMMESHHLTVSEATGVLALVRITIKRKSVLIKVLKTYT